MNILIYTYGNHKMGMGHIYRMLNLATLLREKGHNILFLVPSWKEGIKEISKQGEKIIKIPINDFKRESPHKSLLEDHSFDCIIVDALNVAKPIMKLFRNKAKILLSLDNTGNGRIFSDILINVLYRKKPTLLKPKIEVNDFNYLILNRNFKKFNAKKKIIKKKIEKVLITQGGSDTYGITPKIIAELNKFSDRKIKYYVMVGPAFKHFKKLKSTVKRSNLNIRILKNVTKTWELFYKMDIAVSGAGMTLFELMCLGVPCLVLTQEYKEMETIDYLKGRGFIESLGLYEKTKKDDILNKAEDLINNYDRRIEMNRNSKKAIDGKGGGRIIKLIEDRFNKINEKQ